MHAVPPQARRRLGGQVQRGRALERCSPQWWMICCSAPKQLPCTWRPEHMRISPPRSTHPRLAGPHGGRPRVHVRLTVRDVEVACHDDRLALRLLPHMRRKCCIMRRGMKGRSSGIHQQSDAGAPPPLTTTSFHRQAACLPSLTLVPLQSVFQPLQLRAGEDDVSVHQNKVPKLCCQHPPLVVRPAPGPSHASAHCQRRPPARWGTTGAEGQGIGGEAVLCHMQAVPARTAAALPSTGAGYTLFRSFIAMRSHTNHPLTGRE